MTDVQTKIGLEVFRDDPSVADHWGRCGLLLNQASLTADFQPAWQVFFNKLGKERLVALFGPQHGLDGTEQDNMIESDHETHKLSGLPVYSLYSETREPTEKMLAGLDTLVIDLQIVGCRIYTWKSTIGACLRAGKKYGKRIVVLDRPNPLGGGTVEGTVLEPQAKSFVGQFPTPMRHGLSVGESAKFFNSFIGAELEVVQMLEWNSAKDWRATNRPWVMTSPNLPTLDSVFVYPGMVMFEGTNLSEGRGTTMPFQLIGAPYIKDAEKFVRRITDYAGEEGTSGLYLRPLSFKPTFHKWTDQECRGLQLHVLEPEKVRSFKLALSIIKAAMDLGEGKFEFSEPPYEYNFDTTPIKLILGTLDALDSFGGGFSVNDPLWNRGISNYINNIKEFLIYEREQSISL